MGLREDVVVKDHEGMVDDGARVAQRLTEADLALPVGGQVLDQDDARAGLEIALDQGVPAESLGLFADILHRQHQPVGDPGGERDAGGLAPGDGVDGFEPDLADDRRGGEIHQGLAHPRKRDQPAAIDIDRARPARGEPIGIVGAEAHRLDLDQHPRRHLGDQRLVRERRRQHPFLPSLAFAHAPGGLI